MLIQSLNFMDYHLKILNKERKEIFSQLGFVEKLDWYLAGGTALALQLGHRTSIDFDFYTSKRFQPEKILDIFENRFPNRVKTILKKEDTLIINIDKVEISCFFYKYPLIYSLVKINSVPVASIKDIVAMKIAAISQRGTKRDFIDLYYLLQEFDLAEIFKFTKKKYPKINFYHILRSLTFFQDAETEDKSRKGRIRMFDSNFSWSKVKKNLIEQAIDYQKEMMKK